MALVPRVREHLWAPGFSAQPEQLNVPEGSGEDCVLCALRVWLLEACPFLAQAFVQEQRGSMKFLQLWNLFPPSLSGLFCC